MTEPVSQYWGKGRMPAMMDACVGDPKWRVLVKMFGWVEKLGQLALGNFNPEVHVVRGERRAALDQMVREGKACVYSANDPETQRSHAVLWLAVFRPCAAWPLGLKYLFDESPRVTEGEWVNGNGERGEGQSIYRATGANWYKRHMREREREWNVCDALWLQYREALKATVKESAVFAGQDIRPLVVLRRGDPRGFATEESTATGTKNLFEVFREDHAAEHVDYCPMVFHPARVRQASVLDIDIIIGLLKYDEDKADREGGLTAENTPQLLVSERCGNFIKCALNYSLTDTGKKDAESPYADFIDAARYLFSGPTQFVDQEAGCVVGGGAW